MKVMCINDSRFEQYSDNTPKMGEVVTVAGQCPYFPNNWDIVGYLTNSKGKPQSFHKICFAPLSDIDETELAEQRELQTV